jgi:uncharacterized protein YjiS (DUF1127 family)
MPNPKSGTFDLGDGQSSLVLPRLASRPRAARTMGRFRKTVCELTTSFLAWRAQRETLRVLSSLDAATLRDLGLTDIESAVYGAPQDRVRGYDPRWWQTRWC